MIELQLHSDAELLAAIATLPIETALPPSFLDTVALTAESAEKIIEALRLNVYAYERPKFEGLIPDEYRGVASAELLEGILRQYFTQVDLAAELGLKNRAKPSGMEADDFLWQNASQASGDPVLWKRLVHTYLHAYVDNTLARAEADIKEYAKRRFGSINERLHAEGIENLPLAQLDGVMAAECSRLRSTYYKVLGTPQDDLELLYKLSFQECVKARGWDQLSDEPLIEVLEQEQVPLQLFEEYTGKKIKLSKKEPETVQEVIKKVKEKAERHSRSGSGSFGGELILMPKTSSYAQGVHSLQATCKNEPNSPHRTFTRADGIIVYRPFTFRENLLARVTDFGTHHDASGAKRSLADRLRFFDHFLDSCTGAAYEAGTDMMKIISPCEPLIAIAPDFSDGFLAVSYASLDGYELDRSRHPHGSSLEKSQVIDDPYWLAAVEEDEDLLKEYADIVFSLLLKKYDLTKGMGFFLRSWTTTDELRALFVENLFDNSVAYGNNNLNLCCSFLRVAPSSDAPAGRRA